MFHGHESNGAGAQIKTGSTVTTDKELRSRLWDCANILRGSAVDRTDWKGYILPLLFFKRISDVWDEEIAEATEIHGDADPIQAPSRHRAIRTSVRLYPGVLLALVEPITYERWLVGIVS